MTRGWAQRNWTIFLFNVIFFFPPKLLSMLITQVNSLLAYGFTNFSTEAPPGWKSHKATLSNLNSYRCTYCHALFKLKQKAETCKWCTTFFLICGDLCQLTCLDLFAYVKVYKRWPRNQLSRLNTWMPIISIKPPKHLTGLWKLSLILFHLQLQCGLLLWLFSAT